MRLAHPKVPLYQNPWFWLGIGVPLIIFLVLLLIYLAPHPVCTSDGDCPRGYSCINQDCAKTATVSPVTQTTQPQVVGSVCGDAVCDPGESCVPDCGCTTDADCESYYNSIYYGCDATTCVLQGSAESSVSTSTNNGGSSSTTETTTTATSTCVDSDCSSYICDPNTNACYTSCNPAGDGSECASGYTCDSTGTCVEKCTNENDCLPYDCNSATSLCYESCTSDAECGSGNECDVLPTEYTLNVGDSVDVLVDGASKVLTLVDVSDVSVFVDVDGIENETIFIGTPQIFDGINISVESTNVTDAWAQLTIAGSGICVECDQNTDCNGNYVCNLTSYTCDTTCTDDSSCAYGYTCSSSGTCTPLCTSDSDCLDHFACVDGTCSSNCTLDTDCASGYVCDSGTGTCVQNPPCSTDADCSSGVCVDGACVQCRNNDQCTAGYICDSSTGNCTSSCIDAGDCASGYFCTSDTHVCTPSTCTDASCAPYICDPNADACFTSCIDDTVCASGYSCIDGFCIVPPSPSPCDPSSVPTCADGIDNDGDGKIDLADTECSTWTDDEAGRCMSDSECSAGEICNSGTCIAMTTTTYQCGDLIDNDGDSYIDYLGICSYTQNNGSGMVSLLGSCSAWGYTDAASCQSHCEADLGGVYTVGDSGCTSATDDSEETLNFFGFTATPGELNVTFIDFPDTNQLRLDSGYLEGLGQIKNPLSLTTFQAEVDTWKSLTGAIIWENPSYPDETLYLSLYTDYMGQSDQSAFGFVNYLAQHAYTPKSIPLILTYEHIPLMEMSEALGEHYVGVDISAGYAQGLHDAGYDNYGIALGLMELGFNSATISSRLEDLGYDASTAQATVTALNTESIVDKIMLAHEFLGLNQYQTAERMTEFGVNKSVVTSELKLVYGLSASDANSVLDTASVESIGRNLMVVGWGGELSTEYVTQYSPSTRELYTYLFTQALLSTRASVKELYKMGYGSVAITETVNDYASSMSQTPDYVGLVQGLHDAGYLSSSTIFALVQLGVPQSNMSGILAQGGYNSTEITNGEALLADQSSLTSLVFVWKDLGIISTSAKNRLSSAGIDGTIINTVLEIVYNTNTKFQGAPVLENTATPLQKFWRFMIDGYFAIHGQESLAYPAPQLQTSTLDTLKNYGK